jgi:hypothetical protein
MNKSRIPGFTAENSVSRSIVPYQTTRKVAFRARGRAVQSALMSQGQGLECGGSCPAGQLLCKCDSHCACCIGGCRCTLNGDVLCDKNPALGSSAVGSSAGMFAGLARNALA